MTGPVRGLAGRVGSGIRSRPRLSAAGAAALALILVVAVALAVQGGSSTARRDGSAGGSVAGGVQADGTGDAAGGTTGPEAGPAGGTTGPQAGAAGATSDPRARLPDGTSLPPGAPGAAAPGSGSAGNGAGRGAGMAPSGDSGPGGAPVSVRPPVSCESKGAPTGAPLPSPDEQDGKRWVTVRRLAGNCDAASTGFRLLGIDTRLVWRSDADSFVAFVVDAVQGTDATAGFADAQCAGPCSERLAIVPPPGDYLLQVQAGDAPWEIEIQEYR